MINVTVSSFIRLAKSLLGCTLTCLPSCQTYVDPIPSETDDWGMSQHQEWSGSLHKQGSLRDEGLDKQTTLLAAKYMFGMYDTRSVKRTILDLRC